MFRMVSRREDDMWHFSGVASKTISVDHLVRRLSVQRPVNENENLRLLRRRTRYLYRRIPRDVGAEGQ